MQIISTQSPTSTHLLNHQPEKTTKPCQHPQSTLRKDTVSFGARSKIDKPVNLDAPSSKAARRLLQEISEQPAALRRLIQAFPDNFNGLTLLALTVTELKGVAEGSSLNALSIAAPYIQAFSGHPLKPVSPEVLENELEIIRRYHPNSIKNTPNPFFLTVSQSGRTGSVVSSFSLLQQALGFADSDAPIMPFTNNPDGTLAQRYGNHFSLNVGKEESIAATKSMTASVLALILFGIRTGQVNGILHPSQSQAALQQLAIIPDKLEQFLQNPDTHRQISAFAKRLVKPNNYVLLSKDPMSDILPEAALKLTETSANDVKAYNTEGFRHGPKEILNGINGMAPNTIYIVPPTLSAAGAEKFFKDVASHYFTDDGQPTYGPASLKRVFFIAFENSPPVPPALVKAFDARNRILTLPGTGEITDVLESQLTGIVAFQLLSHYLAEAKGKNPNSKGLNKAVV